MKTKICLCVALLCCVLFRQNAGAQNEPTKILPVPVMEQCKTTMQDVDHLMSERQKIAGQNDKAAIPILPIAPCPVCDYPCRDNYDLSVNSTMIKLHLRLYLFRNDNGDEQFPHLNLENLVAKTNADFAQAFIHFTYDVVYVDENDSKRHNDPVSIALDPEVINVFIRAPNFSANNATYWNFGGIAGNPIQLNERDLQIASTSYTLSHELAHNFGLGHVFDNTPNLGGFGGSCGGGDYPGNPFPNQEFTGDRTTDTKPTIQLGGTYGSCFPGLPSTSYPCNSTLASETWAYYQTLNLASDMYDNFMQYGSPPNCKTTFTPQQIARMRCNINSNPYLQNQTDYVTTHGAINYPFADIQADEQHSLTGQSIQFFSNASSTTATYFWKFGDGGTSTLSNPTHVYTTPGYYNVKLEVFDAAGHSWVQQKNDFVKVNTVGYSLPYSENFDSYTDLPPRDWYLQYQTPATHDYWTWTGVKVRDDFRPYLNAFYPAGTHPAGYTQTVIGASGLSTTAMYVSDNGNISTAQDDLISPDINLGGPGCVLNPVLKFNISYIPAASSTAANCNMTYTALTPGAPVSPIPASFMFAFHKRLQVFASIDGGQTWSGPIYSKSDENLNTIPGTCSAFAFTPSAAGEWRTETVDLSPYLNQHNVRFRFQIEGDAYSNSLYLDNVSVSDNLISSVSLGPDQRVCRNSNVTLGSGIPVIPGLVYEWYKVTLGVPGPVISTTMPLTINANWPPSLVGKTYRLCVSNPGISGCRICDDVEISTRVCNPHTKAGLLENETASTLAVVPNPGTGEFKLIVSSEIMQEVEQITILNALGQVVRNIPVSAYDAKRESIPFDLSGEEKGIYLIQLSGANERIIKKVVLM